MNQHLLTLSHQPLQWINGFPPSFTGKGLPGGTPAYSTGSFGTIVLQRLNTATIQISLTSFELSEPFSYKQTAKADGITGLIMLKGQMQLSNGNGLTKNQAWITTAPLEQAVFTMEPGSHTCFTINFNHEELQPIHSLFSGNLQPGFQLTGWINTEIMATLQSILNCHYPEQLRLHYQMVKSKELLFQFLLLAQQQPVEENQPTAKELEAIHKAEEYITANLSQHLTIPELAIRVLLNEYRLKKLFKQVYGSGPYEYLVHQRMEKAKELLEQGLSVKEVAAATGYRSSDLIYAFREKFGITPGKLKKRNS